ncbi:MAG: alpha/beta hydrolase-fold protein [Terracidiphilus sp.]
MKKIQIPLWALFAVTVSVLNLSACRPALQPLLPDNPRQFPGVAMRDVTFFSPALNRNMPYRVYLPATLAPGQKLPVVYLLHGGGGSFQNWSNYSDVGHFAAHGLILIMADGGSSYYVNAALKPEDKYEDYLLQDLMSDVEMRFPTASGRENRAIMGVSMGGFAAVKLALSRPDLFVFAGAISPAIDVPSRRFSLRRWGQSIRFRAIFGPDGSKARQAADPFLLIRTANPTQTPYLYLTAGQQEPLLEPILRFAHSANQHHFNIEIHTLPGIHTWTQWDAQLPGCFNSLLDHLHANH